MSRPAHSVSLAEARDKLSALVERVSRGEEFVITRHQRPVARLIPAARRDASAEIAKMRATRRRRSATLGEISAWKKQGRR
jgi:prevent-host-death family protein